MESSVGLDSQITPKLTWDKKGNSSRIGGSNNESESPSFSILIAHVTFLISGLKEMLPLLFNDYLERSPRHP